MRREPGPGENADCPARPGMLPLRPPRLSWFRGIIPIWQTNARFIRCSSDGRLVCQRGKIIENGQRAS